MNVYENNNFIALNYSVLNKNMLYNIKNNCLKVCTIQIYVVTLHSKNKNKL